LFRDPVECLLRSLYSVALYLLLPLTVLYLVWRGLKAPAYRQHGAQRLALYYGSAPKKPFRLWLHVASVGEVNAAAPLVNTLRKQRPDVQWLITTLTPTGAQQIQTLWGNAVEQVYLPYDSPDSSARFLNHFRPDLGLILETELWPNLLLGCRKRAIPTYLLNARLSERSLRGYRFLRPLLKRVLQTLRGIAAQSDTDAQRFISLGAEARQIQVLGNMKFDMDLPDTSAMYATFHAHCSAGRPIWIAASTHEGEEQAVLDMHARICAAYPDALLLWAPRHPERFAAVTALSQQRGWNVSTRRSAQWPQTDTQVFVIDTLGELMAFYACAPVGFIGGSLQPIGGHNFLEPAAMGMAMVTGPYLHNFADISRRLQEAGALRILKNGEELAETLIELLSNNAARAQMVTAGKTLLAQGRGSIQRMLTFISAHLPPVPTKD